MIDPQRPRHVGRDRAEPLAAPDAEQKHQGFVGCRCTCGAGERLNPYAARIGQLGDVEARYEAGLIDADGKLMEHLALFGRWFQLGVEAVAKFCTCPDAVRVRAGNPDA